MSQINWDEAVFTTASRLIFFFTTVDKYQEIGEISYWTFVPFLSDTGFFLLNSPWCFAFMVFFSSCDLYLSDSCFFCSKQAEPIRDSNLETLQLADWSERIETCVHYGCILIVPGFPCKMINHRESSQL